MALRGLAQANRCVAKARGEAVLGGTPDMREGRRGTGSGRQGTMSVDLVQAGIQHSPLTRMARNGCGAASSTSSQIIWVRNLRI